MITEFASIQLSREELQELHAALLSRAILEDELRRERGQESVEPHPLLDKVEMLLGEREESLHALDHAIEDELWEYVWYVFTDEWARYRAMQDARIQAGKSRKLAESTENLDKVADQLYQKRFEAYISEISMMEAKTPRPVRSQEKSPGSRSSSDREIQS